MSPATNSSTARPAAKPPGKRRFRPIRLLLILALLCILSLAVPSVFQFVIQQLISYEMWRTGGSIEMNSVTGSLWEPVRLDGVRIFRTSDSGATTRMEIASLEGTFKWQELFARNGGKWFERLQAKGVRGKVDLATSGEYHEITSARENRPRIPLPRRIDASDVELTIVAGNDYTKFTGGRWTLSNVEPGKIEFDQIQVKQPWFTRAFRDVKGTTAIKEDTAKGDSVVIADLQLEKGVKFNQIAAKLSDLADGALNADVDLTAFGGSIRGQAKTLRSERQPGFEVSGKLLEVGIAPLATFLGVSDAAGGTIKEGNFSFRGSIRNLAKAAATLRLEATNFQWESRQWDSLQIGATLVDKRVQVPELELHQGHNHLSLNGEMTLPSAKVPWWQSEFSVNIAAKIDNLTELSALMLPDFKYAAGKVNIDGAVRGKNQQFNGALIVSGSNMTWRNAPIEELHAALKINGNELQVANLELLNKNDFVRGRGVVNILGEKQYWGELRASVEELGTYAALLQKPIVPEPLAGGANVNWSGEGSAKGHSGQFFARLQKLRTLGATGAFIHPLQATLDGAYAAGSLQFSKFALSDESSSFTANVAVGNKALSLQNIQLTHDREVWLEGNAVLPLDVWQAWPNTDIKTLLTDGVPANIHLVAKGLQLREASRLTGWKWPIAGVVDGTVDATGPVGAMQSSGAVTVRNAEIPLAGDLPALQEVSADVALQGQALTIAAFKARHSTGDYSVSGTIDFTNVRDTTLQLELTGIGIRVPLFTGIDLPVLEQETATVSPSLRSTCDLRLKVEGLASKAAVSGIAKLVDLDLGGVPDTNRLWVGEIPRSLPPLIRFQNPPWKAWTLNVEIIVNAPVRPLEGYVSGILWRALLPAPVRMQGGLQVTGSPAAPELSGITEVIVSAIYGDETRELVRPEAVVFRPGQSANPTLDLIGVKVVGTEPVFIHVAGPWTNPVRTYSTDFHTDDERAKRAFEAEPDQEGLQAVRSMKLSASEFWTRDSVMYDWPPIPEPLATVPPPGSGTSVEPQGEPHPTVPSPAPAPPVPTPRPPEGATPPAAPNPPQ